jgi:6-pyruvoyltetrahydropterin/6-carboxytetrahydropterin synthase
MTDSESKPKIKAVRILKFDAGHRVVNHESKCRTLHGHEYKAEIFAEGCLDSLGRVIDFSVIKQKIGTWIDENWDHAMIIFEEDPDIWLLQQCSGLKPVYVTKYNPTAENLAADLLRKSNGLLFGTGVYVTKIKLWETSNCYVEVEESCAKN